MANQLTRYATVATVDTAAQGYFVGLEVFAGEGSSGTILIGVNETRVYQFVLPFRAVVRNITTEVTTGGAAGKKYGAGLYDASKNRLLHTGALVHCVATSSPVCARK